MTDLPATDVAGAWDAPTCLALIDELLHLRAAMLEAPQRLMPELARVQPHWRASAINLAHYLAMRRHDNRRLQERLAWVGVSSLGRAETHALASVDKVLGLLHLATGQAWAARSDDEPVGARRGPALLEQHAQALFGPPPPQRAVRIMVTLPDSAAADSRLIRTLVRGGMDVARINCAHDEPAAWVDMARRVRQQARRAGRPVRILMDLAGPKLRTGPIAGGPPVLKVKPRRDAFGTVTVPALLGLYPRGGRAPLDAPAAVAVDPDWLAQLRVGDSVHLLDARGAERQFLVRDCAAAGVVLAGQRTAYLVGETRLELRRRLGGALSSSVGGLPPAPAGLRLRRGDRLRVTPRGIGAPGAPAAGRRRARPATVPCTLPQVLGQVRRGERVWFDDGRIGGVIRRVGRAGALVEITDCPPDGATLRADRGINLPDSTLHLPALTEKDIEDLAVVVKHADLVGLSFAQSAQDVHTLQEQLERLGGGQLGIVLKVETRRGFAHLPDMLLAGMGSPVLGVMIARGDLAIECGFERLAEVQEELLWACEAAHVPVVWATQVLEGLAKTGQPSRAEITDAAMGGRAECVMLNKGPHIADALRALDDILRRMQAHQAKKRSLLRALKSWPEPDHAAD